MVTTMRRDWDDSVGTPIEQARRIHAEHGRSFRQQTSASGIAARREAVLARSREQRRAT